MRRCILLVALMLCTLEVQADRVPYRYFSVAEGLAHENVTALEQTPDGRLWIGTTAGLSYYNGRTFTQVVFPDSLGPVNIREIHAMPSGGVWVATQYQGVWQVRQMMAVKRVAELSSVRALRLLSRPDTLMIVTRTALWTLDLAHRTIDRLPFRHVLSGDPPFHPQNVVAVMDADLHPDGSLWVLDERYGPGRVHSDGTIAFSEMSERHPDEVVWNQLRFDRAGTGWLTHFDDGLYRMNVVSGERTLVLQGRGRQHICITPQVVAVSSYGMGVLRWDVEHERALPPLGKAMGLPTNLINCILRDHEGNLWIGTQSGLLQMANPGIRHLTEIDGTSVVNLHGLVQDDGALWTASATEGLFRLGPDRAAVQPDGERRWTDVFAGRDGRIHALGRSGWYTRTAERRWRPLTPYHGALRGTVDPQGNGYFIHADGLYRHASGSAPQALERWPTEEAANHLHTLTDDGRLLLWKNGTLLNVHPAGAGADTLAYFPEYRGLEVNALLVDPAGRVWLSLLGRGLLCIEPTGAMLLLPGRQLYRLVMIGERLLVACASDGLFGFELPPATEPREDLVRTIAEQDPITGLFSHEVVQATLRFHLTQADGLLSSFVTGMALIDDLLWIAHPGGVTLYPSRYLHVTPPPPNVLLTSVERNGVELDLEQGPRRTVLGSNVGFAFSATTYVRPHQVEYRYRLDGYQRDWQATQHTMAQYTNLPPGRYAFEVQARGATDAAFGPMTTFNFRVPPPYYRHPLFWLVVASLTGALLFLAHRYRLRSLLRIERTRTQIAMDLHDDIGSSLMSLSFLSALARQRVDEDGPAESVTPLLKEIGKTSSELVDSMSDIVWAVDPQQDTLASVIERLQSFCQRTVSGSDIDINWRLPGHLGEVKLPPQARRNLYLILKEGITNAIKHSHSTLIDVDLHLGENWLAAVIRDHGRGFDASRPTHGNGRRSMRARAEQAGGRLALTSAPGEGTTLEVTWPLHPVRE